MEFGRQERVQEALLGEVERLGVRHAVRPSVKRLLGALGEETAS